MELEISVEAEKRKLNSLVALTVVLLSVFMGLGKLKDDNIVQARQLQKADAMDTWSQYQSKKIKQHLAESNLRQAQILALTSPAAASQIAVIEKDIARDISRYGAEAKELQKQAQEKDEGVEAFNARHDLFDVSDAALSIAVACAAVAALAANLVPLFCAWGFGAVGAFFWLAGFAGWNVHPGWIISLLG